jgi:hypothetical protein
MPVIEATERWLDARLATIASALHLPCPVRESFAFGADYAFYASCTDSDAALQRAAKRVFQHAGMACDAVVVVWRTGLGQPAKVDHDGDTWFVEIDAAFKTNASALGAILAREAARAVLAQRGVARSRNVVDEVDVDLAAALLGLGPVLVVHDASYGALRMRLLRYVHARVAASLRIGLGRALDVPLATRTTRAELALTWLRASRRPLAFAPVPSHVILRCGCAKRLRVPTGTPGVSTCPACKRRRDFDGRPCRALIIQQPTSAPAIQPPQVTSLGRVGLALADLPLAAHVGVIALAAFVLVLAVL